MARRKSRSQGTDMLLATLLQQLLDGGNGVAFQIRKWDAQKSVLDGDHIRLREDDAEIYLNEGVLRLQEVGTVCYRLTPEGIRRALPFVKFKPLDIEALMGWLCERALFNPAKELDGETAIPLIYKPGTSRLVLVLGENAGGKSLVRRILRQGTHPGQKASWSQEEIPKGPFPVREFVAVSMQFRTRGGVESAMVFGDETWQSTGEISSRTVTVGIRTITERDHPTILYWDEPDIGMSAGAAAGAGVVIREFVENLPPLNQAVFITSHSPALIRQLAPMNPHYLYVGDAHGPADLDAWFEYQQNPPPVRPEVLSSMSHQRFLRIKKVMDG